MDFLLTLVIVVGGIAWAVSASRFRRIEQKLKDLQVERVADTSRLITRIYDLERQVIALQTSAVPVREPAPEPVRPTALPPVHIPEPTPIPRPTPPPPPIHIPAETPVAPPTPPVRPVFVETPPVHVETWSEKARDRFAGKEWEAVVGGNWLNKLGVLVLIIGIALLLGYEVTRVGPGGRVAIGFAVSASMLLAGVFVERRPLYRIFATGLIGGGWAGIYFTTYAMYALDAARVINDPLLASVLLAIVATGMILHSLKYRSQAVSGLAYFVAFATLVITPVTQFSVIALLPLAASLLYLANRFDWFAMALFGLLATYGACASRGDAGAPLAATQGIVASYWLLFEVFAIMRAARPRVYQAAEQWIFPLNTAGLIALSYPKWQSVARADLYLFFAGLTAVHLFGALLRARVRPPSTAPEKMLAERLISGGYEGPITLTTLFCAIAICLKLDGPWINLGLLVEGEALFLAGVKLGETYLEQLAAVVFAGSLAKLIGMDLLSGKTIPAVGARLMEWTPVSALSALVFYGNRWIRRSASYYSYGAALLVTLVLGFEVQREYVAAAWLAFALSLFEFGMYRRLLEFRVQAYAVATGALIAVAANNVIQATASGYHWLPLAIAALIYYVIALRSGRPGIGLTAWESSNVSLGASMASTLCMVAFVWRLLATEYLGLGWLVLAAAMLELGLRRQPAAFRWLSYLVAALGWAELLITHVFGATKGAPVSVRMTLIAAAVVSYGMAVRVFRSMPDRIDERERGLLRDASSAMGTVLLCTLIWVVAATPVVATAWMLVSLALIEIGIRTNVASLRLQGDVLHGAVFVRLFLANFVNLGATAGMSHRLLTIVPIIAAEYYLWWRRRIDDRAWDRRLAAIYVNAPAILAILLMRFELGRVLAVVGWSAFGLALYWLGTRLSQPDYRRQSYIIAGLTFWRSWTTNFYAPESFAGVPGRIATGAFVIAMLYLAQFAAPRKGPGEPPVPDPLFGWIDGYARPFFSLLATALLSVLLYYEVQGGMLTVAWGVEAVALLVAGFTLRDRALRLPGLVLFLACILKLFLYDLRHLETVNRIISFVALGAIMVGVSWVYTRFRDRIQRYL